MVYIAVALWTYLLFYNANSFSKKTKIAFTTKKWYKVSEQKISFLAIFILLFFAAIRTPSVGYDTPNYFENIKRMVDSQTINGYEYEILFQIINFFPAIILKNYYSFNVMLLISYSIILLNVSYASKKLSKDITLTIFLYVCVDVYLRSFGQLRQGIAISILMVSLTFVKEKRPIQFLASVFLAMCFHKTAIIFLPVYLFNYVKTKYLYYIFILVLSILVCLFNKPIIKVICNIFGFDYYDRYISQDYGREGFSTVGILEIISITLIFLFFMLYKIRYEKNGVKINSDYSLFLNVLFLCVIMYYCSFILQKPELFGRLVYYYFWSIIFIVPSFLETIKNVKIKKIAKYGMMCVGFSYLIFSVCLYDAYGIKHYISIFNSGL